MNSLHSIRLFFVAALDDSVSTIAMEVGGYIGPV